MRRFKLIFAAMLVTTIGAKTIDYDTVVDYPSKYRSWQHIKTMIIQPGHPLEDPFGGIHHIYANSKAMVGLKQHEYEDGAVFVFDLLKYNESNRLIIEAGRKRLDVMQYDRKVFSETGGWGYATFVGDSKTERWEQNVLTECYSCHLGTKETNYVFSKYRL
jgi:hypothetical protein